jgi:hypothetical protein
MRGCLGLMLVHLVSDHGSESFDVCVPVGMGTNTCSAETR